MADFQPLAVPTKPQFPNLHAITLSTDLPLVMLPRVLPLKATKLQGNLSVTEE